MLKRELISPASIVIDFATAVVVSPVCPSELVTEASCDANSVTS